MMNARRGLLAVVAVLLSSALYAQPFGYAVNSDDEFNADSLLRVNLANGDVQFIGSLPQYLEDVEGLAFDVEGNLFAVDNATKSLVRVNILTGNATSVNNRQANLGFRTTVALDLGMTFDCNGNLLLVAEQTQSLYRVDTSSGQASVIGQSGGLGDAMTAIASYGASVFALAAGSSKLYQIDQQAGTAQLHMSLDGYVISDAGMAFDESGYLWAVLDGSGQNSDGDAMFEPSKVLRINVNSKEVLAVALTRTGIESLAIGSPGSCDLQGLPGPAGPGPGPGPASGPPVAVPSLSQWSLLLLISLLAVLGYRRLRLTH